MPFDETIAERVRQVLRRRRGITEKKMFGGIAFMVNGNMVCGVLQDKLMLRLGEEGAEEALREPHVRVMDFTGKPMKSMVYVSREGYDTEEDFRAWVLRAFEFAKSLPAK